MRILVVDDNVDFLESFALLLGSAGYETATTNDAKKALAMHDRQPADLLITDIFMPDTDGLETISQFRSRWPQLKIIAMSGGGEVVRVDYLRMANRFGADATMRKPVEPRELLRAVAALEEGPRESVR